MTDSKLQSKGDAQEFKQSQHPKLNDEPSLSDFFNSAELSDITVIDNTNARQQRQYKLHRIILASKSAYFRRLFKERPNEKEIVLPDLIRLDVYQTPQQQMLRINNNQVVKEVNVVESVLKFIYSDYDFTILTNEGLSTLNCMNFFSYFSTLQVNSGIFLMEKYILQYILNKENSLEILQIGLQFGNQAFQDNAVLQVAERFGKLLQKSTYFYGQLLDLPYEAFQKLLSSQDIQVDNEDLILSIVHDYIEQQGGAGQHQSSSQQDNISQNDTSKNQLGSDILSEGLKQGEIKGSSQIKTTNEVEGESKDNNTTSQNEGNSQSAVPASTSGVEEESKLNNNQSESNTEQIKSQEEQSKQSETNKESATDVDKSKTNQTDQSASEGDKSNTISKSQNKLINDQSIVQKLIGTSNTEDKTEQEKPSELSNKHNGESNPSAILPPANSQSALNESKKVTFDLKSQFSLQKQQKKGLSEQQIEQLLSYVRLGYVSHSALTHFSQQPVFKSQRELFYRAISLKLSKYEQNSVPNYQGLNWDPRESYVNNVALLNPAITETQHNVKSNNKNASKSNFSPPSSQIFSNRPQQNTSDYQKGVFFNTNEKQPVYVKPNQSGSLLFTYSQDFDDNGLFYYLGSKGKKIEFINPFFLNELMPFCSTLKYGKIEDLTARLSNNTICTENEKNSFFGFDLGEDRHFFPTCYTLRNRSTPSNTLYNWIIEGSNDNKQWYEIDKRIHFSKDSKYNLLLEKERELLRKPNDTSTWGVDTAKLKQVLRTISIDALGFRAFRITQLSSNGSNTNEFALGAIEFYGKAYGMNWTF